MELTALKRIVFIGSVNHTSICIEEFAQRCQKSKIVGVFSYQPEHVSCISNYNDLVAVCQEYKIPQIHFKNLNDTWVVSKLRSLKPDFVFVVGLSKIVDKTIMSIPKYFCIGFHPTRLPQGRGRAPVPWMILKQLDGASSFFKLDEGTDSGDILEQDTFSISASVFASDVHQKFIEPSKVALAKLIKSLEEESGVQTQDESEATCSKRTPMDGLIHWGNPLSENLRLIRATSDPYPGAFSYLNGKKIIIWRGEAVLGDSPVTETGIVVDFQDNMPIITANGGMIVLRDYEIEGELKLGDRLGAIG